MTERPVPCDEGGEAPCFAHLFEDELAEQEGDCAEGVPSQPPGAPDRSGGTATP